MTNILGKKWVQPLFSREWGAWLKPSTVAGMIGEDCIASLGCNLSPGENFQCAMEARETPTATPQRLKYVEASNIGASALLRLDLMDMPVAAGTEWRVVLLTGNPESAELFSSYLPL